MAVIVDTQCLELYSGCAFLSKVSTIKILHVSHLIRRQIYCNKHFIDQGDPPNFGNQCKTHCDINHPRASLVDKQHNSDEMWTVDFSIKPYQHILVVAKTLQLWVKKHMFRQDPQHISQRCEPGPFRGFR